MILPSRSDSFWRASSPLTDAADVLILVF